MTALPVASDLAGLASLLLDYERPAWDLLPSIGLVYDHGDAVLLPRFAAVPLATPDELWRRLHQVEVVRLTGHALQHLPPAPGSVAGIWLVCESWAAPPAHADEIRRRHAAGGSTPRFETLPGAIERREALIVSRDGQPTWASLERATLDRATSSPSDKVGGRLIDALRHTMQMVVDRERVR